MPPDEPNDEERLEELPADDGTPFDFPSERVRTPERDGVEDERDALDSTHPATDSNLQQQEIYDEGLSGAAEAREPNAGDTVLSYKPKPEAGKERSGEVDGPTGTDLP